MANAARRAHDPAVAEQECVHGAGTIRDAARKEGDRTGQTKHTVWTRSIREESVGRVGRSVAFCHLLSISEIARPVPRSKPEAECG